MERDRAPQVDASEAVRGLARLSGAIQDGGGDTPLIDPNLGQGTAAGVAAIGSGIEDVGAALFDINARVLKAKNYADEHAAQIAMDREVLEHEKWKQEHPNPEEWESGWAGRMQQFQNQYFSGKNLSPAAETSIRQRMEAFTGDYGVRVGMEAMRQTVGNATSALKADVLRAEDSGDYETGAALLDQGVREGWLPEDIAAGRKIQMQDNIEAKQLQTLSDLISADKDDNDYPAAKDRTQRAFEDGLLNESEYKAQLASLKKEERYQGVIEIVRQDSAKDLRGTRKRLFERGDDGEYKYHPEMTEADRKNAAAGMDGEIAMENKATVGEILMDYNRGSIQGDDLGRDFRYLGLPQDQREMLQSRIREGALNSFMDFGDFRDSVWDKLDPRSADAQTQRELLETEAELRFDGEMLEGAQGLINDRMQNPDPMKPDEYARSQARSYWKERFMQEDLGRFKFSREDVKLVEKTDAEGNKTGEKVYAVRDDNPPTAFGFKSKKYIFGMGGNSYREIILTPDQEREWNKDNSKLDYIDQNYYRKAGQELERAFETVGRKEDFGEIQNVNDYNREMGDLIGASEIAVYDPLHGTSVFPGMGTNQPEPVFYGPSDDRIDAAIERAKRVEASATF